jgi:hypothetical protein
MDLSCFLSRSHSSSSTAAEEACGGYIDQYNTLTSDLGRKAENTTHGGRNRAEGRGAKEQPHQAWSWPPGTYVLCASLVGTPSAAMTRGPV